MTGWDFENCVVKLTIAIFVGLLAVIVIGADTGALPDFVRTLYSFPGGDKAGHFLLMGTLSALINLGLGANPAALGSRRFILGSIVVMVAVTLEEVSQLWFRTRTFSPLDLSFDYAGILCGAYLASLMSRRRQSSGARRHDAASAPE